MLRFVSIEEVTDWTFSQMADEGGHLRATGVIRLNMGRTVQLSKLRVLITR